MNQSNEKNNPVYLSLYPNRLGFGYVCLESAKTIIDSGIATAHPISNATLLKRVEKYLERYQPSLVILPEHSSKLSRYGKRVRKLIEEIVSLCQKQGVGVKQYSREQIRFVFEQFKAKNKYEISQKIIEGFPELQSLAPRKRKPYNPDDYSMGIFDALALFFTHLYVTT